MITIGTFRLEGKSYTGICSAEPAVPGKSRGTRQQLCDRSTTRKLVYRLYRYHRPGGGCLSRLDRSTRREASRSRG